MAEAADFLRNRAHKSAICLPYLIASTNDRESGDRREFSGWAHLIVM
jgi:hypothetical protein